jgi:prolyl-tRNA synthetase
MIARQSRLFIPTLREAPADAEAVSHKLLVRGGYIRQVAAGVWTFLPLGWRVHRKVVQIIREEMDAIGGQEMLMPVLTPVELWQHTKRDHIEELFRLKDRNGRDYVLPMTHEETVTFHAKEISSYRQLPQLLYHFSIKERDEPRSRGGLLRLREFIMKDAYSFDRDDAGLAAAFEANEGAYHRMFRRAGLEYSAVQAESGMMGGKESVDFLAPSDPARTRSSRARTETMRRISRSPAACRVLPILPSCRMLRRTSRPQESPRSKPWRSSSASTRLRRRRRCPS